MRLSESRIRQIIREELSRESRLQEGFFDTIKGFFGGNDPYEHFTTKHEKWQVMKSKMDKGVSPLSFLKNLDSGALDAKFIPKEWSSSPSDRKAYREAMKRAILDYNVKAVAKLQDKKRKDRDRPSRFDKNVDQERDSPKPWSWERDPAKDDDDEPDDPYKFRGVDRIGAPSNPNKSYYNTRDVDQPDYDELRKLS